VQVPRIQPRLKTPLDRLLSVFEQTNFIDKTEADKTYDYPISDEGVKEITDILHYISTDPKARKELEDERYYRQYVDDTFGGLYREIEDKNRAIAKKEAELANKDTELANKDAELANKDTEIADKDAELANQAAELAELKRKLEKYEG
jgi:chromosome segregation ATPase